MAGIGDFSGDSMPTSYRKTPAPANVAFDSSKKDVFSRSILLATARLGGNGGPPKNFGGDSSAGLVWEDIGTGRRAIWFMKQGV